VKQLVVKLIEALALTASALRAALIVMVTSEPLSSPRKIMYFNSESREDLGRGLSFRVVPHDGHRSAPRVIAALTGLVHDRQSAADYEYNHDKNNY
jgi:hypothetical protein